MVPIIRYAWQRNFAIAKKKVKVHLYDSIGESVPL